MAGSSHVPKSPETIFRLKVNGMGRKVLEASMDWNDPAHKWLWYKALEDNHGDHDLTIWLQQTLVSAGFLFEADQEIGQPPFIDIMQD